MYEFNSEQLITMYNIYMLISQFKHLIFNKIIKDTYQAPSASVQTVSHDLQQEYPFLEPVQVSAAELDSHESGIPHQELLSTPLNNKIIKYYKIHI